ncbi:AAT family amino acid transporter [Aureobasidium subglaciale]|nr:AAT family amino acid transporter [Aureobasidium subglaciale]KAI5231106.1 AAT family amino acid transporter [Aureobasidium subglaciale]KAI5234195.1 AAT family amino acid transporter [Aureobasidium subglaciale]KAI5257184.1 AAT family amino acid transporter [Aureobasidium subglaciale]KAI5267631.1 AAT family amino acid transporter [Aureobasidium subglaciale]
MSDNDEKTYGEKHAHSASLGDHLHGQQLGTGPEVHDVVVGDQNELHRELKGRHMQMIAIGGAIGAGLFIGSGSAFQSGGPGSVLIGFMLVGSYFMMQALAEMSVMYPINGAFAMYICRFVDPSFGFACAWEYAISWLTVLPYEISAAVNIIHYWEGSLNVNASAFIVPLLVALVVIQFFGVRGYGEVEYVLSVIKILACVGFMILGVIIDTGGIPGDPSGRGYIGGKIISQNTFRNGFHGFCSVFVTAAFAYTGTELTGLAAAETINPKKEIPKASKQVIFRIIIFYGVNLLLIGLVVPSDPEIYSGPGSSSRYSPFVLAIKLAGIKVLPSIFNAVILVAVMSVANSCTFGSTRTIQALAANGMAPKFLAYVDKKGRPLNVIILQVLFGCLAFINLAPNGGDIFGWLLALSGLSILFIYGGIGLAHVRFRAAWKLNGHTLDELPYKASAGVWGSYFVMLITVLALLAQFYVALYPIGGPNLNASAWFQSYLAGPLLVFLYFLWKVYSWFKRPADRPIWIKTSDIDIYTGMREIERLSDDERMLGEKQKKGPMGYAKKVYNSLF